MSGSSNFGDSMGWGSGRSSSSRKGKRGGGSGAADKPKQPQRGLGVAQLEKIRLQSEMAEFFHPLGQPPLIHRTGSLNLEDARPSTSLSSSPSSSFHAAVSSPFPIHPNLAMAYGERGDIRQGVFQPAPVIRPPSNSTIYGAPHYSHPSVTLPLFEPEESARLKAQHDRSHSADSTSMNSDDPQDVDLELKL